MADEEQQINLTPLWIRRLVWDALPHSEVEAYLPKFGLMPGSPEGHEMEHVNSHKRIEKLAPISDVLVATTQLTGSVLGKAIVEHQEITDPALIERAIRAYTTSVHAGSVAVLATLLDEGLIEITDKDSNGFLG